MYLKKNKQINRMKFSSHRNLAALHTKLKGKLVCHAEALTLRVLFPFKINQCDDCNNVIVSCEEKQVCFQFKS